MHQTSTGPDGKEHNQKTNPLIGKVVAIDGPAGAGKGTLATSLAYCYRLKYLDTGTLYRMVALRVLRAGKNPANEKDAISACNFTNFDFKHIGNNKFSAFIDGEAIMDELRRPEVGSASSKVAFFSGVRSALRDFQQEYAKTWKNRTGVILDGRDIGTSICPDANFKFFLDAAPEIRAKRRMEELYSRGFTASYEETLAEILERDARDRGRKNSPLKPAEDAIIIDSSKISAKNVLQKACFVINVNPVSLFYK